jgi:hypothetical protein
MTRSIGTTLLAVLATMACVVTLAACGGSTPSPTSQSTQTTQNSPPPGQGDAAICQLVSKASAAYNAKDYTAWRSDMAQIANMADSAQYVPIKQVATQLKAILASSSSTTTTTKAGKHTKYKSSTLGSNLRGIFGPIGAYVDLTKTCAHLPT